MANALDRFIGYLSPKRGAERAAYRLRTDILNGARSYEGASNGRLAQGWRAPPGDADTHIARSGQQLRDRSRELVRNNPLAAKIVTVHANNLVGPGIMPRAKTGKASTDKLLNNLFDEWSEQCHVDGATNFYGLCYMMARSMVTDGEQFVRRRRRRMEDGLAVPLQLQILDSEFCDWGKTTVVNGGEVISGIEYDVIGRRRGYWMFNRHPHGRTAKAEALISSFVPAEDIAHAFEPLANQSRGVPWLSPVMTELKDLRDYELAENIRKKVEACHVGVVRPKLGDIDPNVGLEEVPGTNPALRDLYGNPVDRMEPGMFAVASDGAEITFNNPAISAGVEAYIRTRHRSIAAGARQPYELMTGDFSQANFASGQLGLLDYQRFISAIQWHYLIPQVMQRIYGWFLQAAREGGKIPLNLKVTVEWQPPEFEKINRLEDARADLLEVRMGKRSMPEIIAKTGRDPATVVAENDEFFQQLDATVSKLVLDSDPRKVSINGQAQDANQSTGDSSAAGS